MQREGTGHTGTRRPPTLNQGLWTQEDETRGGTEKELLGRSSVGQGQKAEVREDQDCKGSVCWCGHGVSPVRAVLGDSLGGVKAELDLPISSISKSRDNRGS